MFMKRLFSTLLIITFLLFSSTACQQNTKNPNVSETGDRSLSPIEYEKPLEAFSHTWYEYFDTVSTVTAYMNTEAQFQELVSLLEEELLLWHQLLDNFQSYEEVKNIYDLNHANGEWVELDSKLLDVLVFSKDMYDKTKGQLNIAMGQVITLWHTERTKALKREDLQGVLPQAEGLEELRSHIDIQALEIDSQGNRARITDDKVQIDLGAVGKGYVSEYLCSLLKERGYQHVLMNFGGNLAAVNGKADGEWKLGINNPTQDPNNPNDDLLKVLLIDDLNVISSGDYERFYFVGEKKYHHIIDPDTLYPNNEYSQVSIVSENAAWADVLSTALFNMSIEEGEALLDAFPDSAAMWVRSDGTIYTSKTWNKGFKEVNP